MDGNEGSDFVKKLEEIVTLHIWQRNSKSNMIIYDVYATYFGKHMNPCIFEPVCSRVKSNIRDEIIKRTRKFPASEEELMDIGGILYTQFLPPLTRENIQHLDPEYIYVITNDSNIPWELTYDGDDFWCLKYGFSRLPSRPGSFFQERIFIGHRITPISPNEINVLIIADPEGDLKAAAQEADSIESMFKNLTLDRKISVKTLKQKRANLFDVLKELRKPKYDIIHFAGHASLRYEQDGEEAGLKLSDGLLSLNEVKRIRWHVIQKQDRYIAPKKPIVFCNACATESFCFAFIDAGASAFIGTFYETKDSPSAELASVFYKNVVNGLTFGNALREARKQIRTKYKGTSYWAPYILYGISNKGIELGKFSKRYEIIVEMSDAPGTYVKILEILFKYLDVNIISSESRTIERGRRALGIMEIDFPKDTSFAELAEKLKSIAGDIVYDVWLVIRTVRS